MVLLIGLDEDSKTVIGMNHHKINNKIYYFGKKKCIFFVYILTRLVLTVASISVLSTSPLSSLSSIWDKTANLFPFKLSIILSTLRF